MVIKKKRSTAEKKGKAKVSDLKLNKETVKDLTDSEAANIVGGRRMLATAGTMLGCIDETTLQAGCSPSQIAGCAILKKK